MTDARKASLTKDEIFVVLRKKFLTKGEILMLLIPDVSGKILVVVTTDAKKPFWMSRKILVVVTADARKPFWIMMGLLDKANSLRTPSCENFDLESGVWVATTVKT